MNYTTTDSNRYDCGWKDCSKVFTDPEQLYSHLTNDHVGRKSTGNLCLTCHWKDCEVSVIKRDHITSHLRVHVPLKPHHCNYCDKSFKRPQDLKKHEKIHSEDASNGRTRMSHPLTPPRQYDTSSLSPNPSSINHQASLGAPISPPHSTTYSEDGWMHSSSNISPVTESYGSFQSTVESPSLRQEPFSPYSQQNDFGFNNNNNNTMAYNTNASDELIQSLMFADNSQMKTEYDTEMVDNLDMLQNLVDNGSINPSSLQINNEEQLEKFNLWLGQLTENMEMGTAAYPDQQQQQQQQQQPNYTDMLLQFNTTVPNMPMNNDNNNGLYPNALEQQQDMYVRSLPMMQPSAADYTTDQNKELYGGQLGDSNNYEYPNANAFFQQQAAITGLKYHYTNLPAVASTNDMFVPDLRTAMNFGNSKDSVKYKAPDNDEKQQDAPEAFKPTKEAAVNHQSKKNVTTMMNVFNATGETKAATPKPVQSTTTKKSSAVSKDVLDLLVSDLTDLSIEKKKKDLDEPLYPAQQTERHQKLLKQLGQWVNQGYSKEKKSLRNGAIVQVQ